MKGSSMEAYQTVHLRQNSISKPQLAKSNRYLESYQMSVNRRGLKTPSGLVEQKYELRNGSDLSRE